MNPQKHNDYRDALKRIIAEASRNLPERIWLDGENIVCNTCTPYADAIFLLCADGTMEMLDDTGKHITAKFVTP